MKADEPTRKIIRDIKDMETARQALIRDRTAAKARLSVATLPLLRRQASLRLRQIERNLAEVDAAIETTIRADTELSRKADILTSTLGTAKVAAFAMLIHMPELGELTGKQVASLGGLAPISRQSASWRCKHHLPASGKMAGQGAYSGRKSPLAKSYVSTDGGCHPFQSRYES